jgi:hypothetical protein
MMLSQSREPADQVSTDSEGLCSGLNCVPRIHIHESVQNPSTSDYDYIWSRGFKEGLKGWGV